MQHRLVTCVAPDINAICTADENLKPPNQRPCSALCGQWTVSHWSENVSIALHDVLKSRFIDEIISA